MSKVHNSKLSENSSFKFYKEHLSSSFLLLQSITAYFFFLSSISFRNRSIVSLKLDKHVDNLKLEIYSTVFLQRSRNFNRISFSIGVKFRFRDQNFTRYDVTVTLILSHGSLMLNYMFLN